MIVPVMAYVCIKLNRRSRRAFAKQRMQIGELNAAIEDSLLGQKVVKAFTNEAVEVEKFEKGNRKFSISKGDLPLYGNIPDRNQSV